MAPPLLTLQDIYLTFGGTPLFEGASLEVRERDRLCLVGRNGSGKSTLLKIACGLVEADKGERFVKPGKTIRYLAQEPEFHDFASVEDYALDGLGPGDEQFRVAYLLEALGLSGKENPQNLSGGEARRAALVKILAPEPDILLLDEPTNHLDINVMEWLENELLQLRSAIVVISHDRQFLKTLSQRTIWVDQGETRTLDKGFEAFENWRDEALEQFERDRHKLDRKIVRENHWLVHGVSARRKRNQKRLKDLQSLRQEYQKLSRKSQRSNATISIETAEAPASGKLVIEADGISKAWGNESVVKGLSLKIQRKDRIGIIGPNGIGKTTLIKLLTGELKPDSGHIRLGTNLEMVTLDQKRENLSPATTLKDELTGGGSDSVMIGDTQRHVVSYMKAFLFLPEQANTPIGALSGGERGRLMLARAFSKPSNFLALDEPTNDLDLETLDLLQELLSDYQGTVLLVSHDRDFLDRVATKTLVSSGEGDWILYIGGYSDMQVQRANTRNNHIPKKSASEKSGSQIRKEKFSKAGQNGKREKNRTQTKKKKLSFKEKHALETLPAELEKLDKQRAALKSQLEDPDFYNRSPEVFEEVAGNLEDIESRLTSLEEEWLRLEALREEIERN